MRFLRLALCLPLLAACAASAPPVPATVHVPSTPPPPAPRAPEPAVKVRGNPEPLAAGCQPGARETCNALDDDCNGVIDDDCGYQTGAVQVTVAWDSGADIDLYVTDPSGETLFYNEKYDHTSLGGHLDHNARGDCRQQKNARIENAYWPAPSPGVYRVALHYFGPCEKSLKTHAKLSLSVRGKLVGSYEYELEPEQRLDALSFEID